MPQRAGIVVRRVSAVLALLLASAAPRLGAAAERSVVVDAGASTITFTLDTTFHEVHGTMPMAGGTLRFDPATGAGSGSVRADVHGARTGNDRRDKTMHAEVLESERYPVLEFRLARVEGTFAETGHSDLRLVGVMTLHGADHPMTLVATVDTAGGVVRGEMHIPIPYVEWGMHDPSFLFVRAEKIVNVTVHVEGRIDAAGAAFRPPETPPTPARGSPAHAAR
jgi:polyisoprenoid-binding protein YceI